MQNDFGLLMEMEYPGRILLLGAIDSSIVMVYAVTARSASSKAKRYILNPDQSRIDVQATDENIISQGNLDLLKYSSVYFYQQGIILGNGRQTEAVVLSDESLDSIDLLRSGLVSWSYEQDEYHTPRITGYVLKKNEEYEAGISIIRDKGLNQSQNDLYRVPLISGQGKMITTYRGENIRPTPSFQDEPFSVEIDAHSAQDMTNAIYEALQPKAGREDLRVSVMSIYLDQSTGHHDIAIRNAVDERLHLNA